MAIIVEEEKSAVPNLTRLGGWLVILIVLGAAGYYLFLAPATPATVVPPANFQALTPLANLSLNPETVLQSAGYVSLKPPSFPLPSASGPAAVGRTNPFIAP